ncbi:MAG: hypothetical protein IKC52_00325 [Clostridia bacterium]|nr:hypothetical protein [Clostridia bacterium]
MSACIFVASNLPLEEHHPSKNFPIQIDLQNNTCFDGNADDNFFLETFQDVDVYTGKTHGVCLQWIYTDGRAKQLVDYLKNAVEQSGVVELWHVWLDDYYEFETRPFVHKQTMQIDSLTIDNIKEICQAQIWNSPDKQHPQRPSFYCLELTK